VSAQDLNRLVDLVDLTVAEEGCERPPIRWHFAPCTYSSGTTYHDRARGIAITLGTDRLDRKLVVLHELAHWLTPEDAGHGRVFWTTAMRLYRRHGIGWATIHRLECQVHRAGTLAHKTHRALVSP
jgi:hypothetical protein